MNMSWKALNFPASPLVKPVRVFIGNQLFRILAGGEIKIILQFIKVLSLATQVFLTWSQTYLDLVDIFQFN